jgi:tol-pal system protein YbgF
VIRGRAHIALVSLGLLPGLYGCVTIAEHRKLEERVAELSGGDIGMQTREQIADVTAELERLGREVSELRGAIEVASHRSERALEEAQAARKEAAAAGRGSAAAAPPPRGEAALGEEEVSVERAARETRPTPESVDVAAPVQGSPGAVRGGSSSAEVESYRAAYAAWRRDEVNACIEGFREFLQNYRSSPYADDALYWKADCHSKQGDNEKAILDFAKVVELYPTSNKAADALFRQGEVLLKLGPGYHKAAREVFGRVVNDYPDSPRADEAKRQLQLLGAG